jgi:hypothetical protein
VTEVSEPLLPDGTYDAMVIDADGDGPGVDLDLTIVAGAHKGEVVSLHADTFEGDPLDALGLPATITVAGGKPSVQLDT